MQLNDTEKLENNLVINLFKGHLTLPSRGGSSYM